MSGKDLEKRYGEIQLDKTGGLLQHGSGEPIITRRNICPRSWSITGPKILRSRIVIEKRIESVIFPFFDITVFIQPTQILTSFGVIRPASYTSRIEQNHKRLSFCITKPRRSLKRVGSHLFILRKAVSSRYTIHPDRTQRLGIVLDGFLVDLQHLGVSN